MIFIINFNNIFNSIMLSMLWFDLFFVYFIANYLKLKTQRFLNGYE